MTPALAPSLAHANRIANSALSRGSLLFHIIVWLLGVFVYVFLICSGFNRSKCIRTYCNVFKMVWHGLKWAPGVLIKSDWFWSTLHMFNHLTCRRSSRAWNCILRSGRTNQIIYHKPKLLWCWMWILISLTLWISIRTVAPTFSTFQGSRILKLEGTFSDFRIISQQFLCHCKPILQVPVM